MAVQAFSSSQLEESGLADLSQLMRAVPGASEGRSTSAGTRSFQIRGVTPLYGDSTVGYFLDDAVFTILNRNWAPVASLFDVERVEVLRWWRRHPGWTALAVSASPSAIPARRRAPAAASLRAARRPRRCAWPATRRWPRSATPLTNRPRTVQPATLPAPP